MFDPIYPMNFKQSDIDSGNVNPDGTANFGGSSFVVNISADEDGLISDKNAFEIVEAYQNGLTPVIRSPFGYGSDNPVGFSLTNLQYDRDVEYPGATAVFTSIEVNGEEGVSCIISKMLLIIMSSTEEDGSIYTEITSEDTSYNLSISR